MDERQKMILSVKANAYNVIAEIIGDVWEYGGAEDDKKHATAATLFEVNGVISMTQKLLSVWQKEEDDEGE